MWKHQGSGGLERECGLCSRGGTVPWKDLQPALIGDKHRRHSRLVEQANTLAPTGCLTEIFGDASPWLLGAMRGWLQGWRVCWGLRCSRSPVMLFSRSSQGFLHLKFARTRENQLVLGQHSGPFASVPELVLHYSSRPLPVQGAEHLALLYPVAMQSPCPPASATCPAP